MGVYDEVKVPCPKCGELYYAQSKGGDSCMMTYALNDCPIEVLCDVNRHAPFECTNCKTNFKVKLEITPSVIKFKEVYLKNNKINIEVDPNIPKGELHCVDPDTGKNNK